ncbi:hypothetical protein FI667_g8088, partial [Globisporangium splendens]
MPSSPVLNLLENNYDGIASPFKYRNDLTVLSISCGQTGDPAEKENALLNPLQREDERNTVPPLACALSMCITHLAFSFSCGGKSWKRSPILILLKCTHLQKLFQTHAEIGTDGKSIADARALEKGRSVFVRR